MERWRGGDKKRREAAHKQRRNRTKEQTRIMLLLLEDMEGGGRIACTHRRKRTGFRFASFNHEVEAVVVGDSILLQSFAVLKLLPRCS